MAGVIFLVEHEFRVEVFGGIGGDEHSEFSGVLVATEDGRQDRVEWVLFAEEVCNETLSGYMYSLQCPCGWW